MSKSKKSAKVVSPTSVAIPTKPTSTAKPAAKPKSISAAYKELEEITESFEKDDLDLEKSIPKFKRGLELSKYLKERLSEIENEIEEIKVSFEKDAK